MTELPILRSEIASIQRDWWGDPYLGVLLPQDTVLRSLDFDLAQYRELLRDEQVYSCWQQRVLATTSKEWRVEPGGPRRADRKAAEFVRELLGRLPWDAITEKMLLARFYGWSVAEAVWASDGGLITLDRLLVRERRRFRFDRERRLRLVTPEALDGEVLPDCKFWVLSSGGEHDDDPYGLGLAHYLYWPVWFKRNFVRFWSVWSEKFASPTVKGVLPRGAGREERAALLEAIRALVQDSGVVVPEGVMIELLEANRAAGGDYEAAVRYCDAGIAKVVLSQTMTTDDGSSLAQAKVHERVKDDIVEADCDLICNAANSSWITWLCRWNWPDAAPPRVWRLCEPPADQGALADRDTKIFALGYSPTADYITETYGPGWVARPSASASAAVAPDGGAVLPPPGEPQPAPATFAETASPVDPVDALADQLAREAAPGVGAMVDALRQLLADSGSLDEVAARLLTLDLPLDHYAEALARGLTAAHLCGQVAVAEEPDG